MRRIPRVKRPSGLTPATANISRSTACPFSSASPSQPTISTPISCCRSTTRSPYILGFGRFYSSEKQQTPTPAPETAPEPGMEVQFSSRVADEVIDAQTEELEWTNVGTTTLNGPYTAPPLRVQAAREDEVADPKYFPATSAEGLKTVGGLANWWNKRENWAVAGDFVGFKPRERVVDPALIEVSVRRAVLEAFALREAGREDDLVGVWPVTVSKADLQGLLSWNVRSTENGAVSLGGDASAVAEGLRWKDDEDAAAVGDEHAVVPEALTPDEASALRQTWDPSWKSISLADPRIRFAVTKRVFQLTGQLVPDHQLTSITTVQNLISTLKRPPKPATLTEEIQKRHPDLLELPNVTFSAKRVTRGDKEIALGRYKLMQEEFKKRDLPGTGHGYARKGKEISRLRGGA